MPRSFTPNGRSTPWWRNSVSARRLGHGVYHELGVWRRLTLRISCAAVDDGERGLYKSVFAHSPMNTANTLLRSPCPADKVRRTKVSHIAFSSHVIWSCLHA
jgi:hypothetical protein